MNTLQFLFRENNKELDKLVYSIVVPFFKNSEHLARYPVIKINDVNGLSLTVQRIFRELVYEQCLDINCTKEQFIELINFLRDISFDKPQFKPLYRRYLFNHRDDKDFMIKTSHIHNDPYFLYKNDNINSTLMLNWLNMGNHDESLDIEKVREEAKLKSSPAAINAYALCLIQGYIPTDDSSHTTIKNLYISNSNYPSSLHNYAFCLQRGFGGETNIEEAKRLYLKNWQENYYCDSLHNYIIMNPDAKERRVEYLKNWEANRCIKSLKNYIFFLTKGIGGEKDLVTAENLKRYLK